MRPHVLGWTLLAAVAIAALAVFGLAGEHTPSGGRLAPALPHESLVGPSQTLASMLSADGHRPALVVFWASWCGPCAHEAPAIERFAQSAEGRGRVVGVNWSDALSGARSFLRRHAWTFPNVRDAEGTVGNAYRITGLPTTFVLDGDGHIRAVLRGPQSERSLEAALRAA
ncbi:MAG TPA: TlpA disulfide reductase family protein [Solirubrobacteraceae bacterium]|nr:TlpA disulfide reductase family protein [Solirubrobacteraceae bacterium]